MKKLFNNKTAKGLLSLFAVILLMCSILAGSYFYDRSVTSYAVKENDVVEKQSPISIKVVKDINELNQLNLGWYQIKNGFVYYLEHFDSPVPLYIRVDSPQQQNGMMIVEEDGTIEFDESFNRLFEKENKEVKSLKQVESNHQDIRMDFTNNDTYNNYLNLLIHSNNGATDAQAGRAADYQSAVRKDIRVQTQSNLNENLGGGVSQDNSQKNKNQITGLATGFERMSGGATEGTTSKEINVKTIPSIWNIYNILGANVNYRYNRDTKKWEYSGGLGWNDVSDNMGWTYSDYYKELSGRLKGKDESQGIEVFRNQHNNVLVVTGLPAPTPTPPTTTPAPPAQAPATQGPEPSAAPSAPLSEPVPVAGASNRISESGTETPSRPSNEQTFKPVSNIVSQSPSKKINGNDVTNVDQIVVRKEIGTPWGMPVQLWKDNKDNYYLVKEDGTSDEKIINIIKKNEGNYEWSELIEPSNQKIEYRNVKYGASRFGTLEAYDTQTNTWVMSIFDPKFQFRDLSNQELNQRIDQGRLSTKSIDKYHFALLLDERYRRYIMASEPEPAIGSARIRTIETVSTIEVKSLSYEQLKSFFIYGQEEGFDTKPYEEEMNRKEQNAPRFSSLESVAAGLELGTYRLDKDSGKIFDSNGELVGILKQKIAKDQKGSEFYVDELPVGGKVVIDKVDFVESSESDVQPVDIPLSPQIADALEERRQQLAGTAPLIAPAAPPTTPPAPPTPPPAPAVPPASPPAPAVPPASPPSTVAPVTIRIPTVPPQQVPRDRSNIPIGSNPVNTYRGWWLATDGNFYYKECQDNCPLLKYNPANPNVPDIIQQTFLFKVIAPDGNILPQYEQLSGTKQEALAAVQKKYPGYKIEIAGQKQQQPLGVGAELTPVGDNQVRISLDDKYLYTLPYETTDEINKANAIFYELSNFQQFRDNNKKVAPTISDAALWQAYISQSSNQDVAQQLAAKFGVQTPQQAGKPGQPKAPEPTQLVGLNGQPIDQWVLPGQTKPLNKQEFDAFIQKQNSDRALKDLGGASIIGVNENGLQIAKKGNDFFQFYPTQNDNKGAFVKIDPNEMPTIKLVETVGKDDNAITITRTIDTKTQQQAGVTVIKGASLASVDDETVKSITKAVNSGLKVDVISESLTHVVSSPELTTDFKVWCNAKDDCKKELNSFTETPSITSSFITIYGNEYYGHTGKLYMTNPDKLTNEELENALTTVKIVDNNGNIEQRSFRPSIGSTPGLKSIEEFKTAYFYKGNEISKEDYDKLAPEERQKGNAKIMENFPTYKSIKEEGLDGKLIASTEYRFDTIFDDKGDPTRTYVGTRTSTAQGVDRFIYGEGSKEIVLSYSGTNIISSKGLSKSDLETFKTKAIKQRDYAKSQQFFVSAEKILTEFRGFGYYATLFINEDSLLKWRDTVDRTFATLYLGTEYWSSSICSSYLHGENIGIAYAETPQGLAQVGAHIEATRTEAITNFSAKHYIYKITFNVRNGDFPKDQRAPEEMNVNVILRGQRTVNLFSQSQNVKRGASFGLSGKNAIVQESANLYSEICMTFDKIPFKWKLSDNELCNTIQESSGQPSIISTPAAATTTSGGASGTTINQI